MSKGGVNINVNDMTSNDMQYLWEAFNKIYRKINK